LLCKNTGIKLHGNIVSNTAVFNSQRLRYLTVISKCDLLSEYVIVPDMRHAHSYDVRTFKLNIPLCDRMTTTYIITVNTTKFWCLLQQHVSTPRGSLHVVFLHVFSLTMTYVGRNMLL